MIMIDGFLLYKTVVFLSAKSANITLKVLKSYQTEAEQQTGKRIRQLSLIWNKSGLTQPGNNIGKIRV